MADRYFRGAMSSASDAPDQGLDRGVVVLGAVPMGRDRLHAGAGHRHPALRLGRRPIGTKRLYMGSIALFMIGSALAGLATLVSLLLPRTKPEPIDDPDDPETRSAEDEAVPVMMG